MPLFCDLAHRRLASAKALAHHAHESRVSHRVAHSGAWLAPPPPPWKTPKPQFITYQARISVQSNGASSLLQKDGFPVGRKRVATLMRRMGIATIYRKPKTCAPETGAAHRIYPYLLRSLTIERPNQVWATDITYIPIATGFVYLVAIMDWASRKVLAWCLSNTLTTDFCVEALNEALAKYGSPEIFNTDQGAQFTDQDFSVVLQAKSIRISMDGKGRWVDNVFVERLWRSLKYEEVYLHAYGSIAEAKSGIAAWFEFYNRIRPHRE